MTKTDEKEEDQEGFTAGTLQAAVARLKKAFIEHEREVFGQDYVFDENASMIDVVEAVAQSFENAVEEVASK